MQRFDLLWIYYVSLVVGEVLFDLLFELRVDSKPDVAVLHYRKLEKQDEYVELLLLDLDL